MTSEKNVSQITLTDGDLSFDFEKNIIEQLGALDYSAEEIAMYFDISVDIIKREISDNESQLSYYLKRGKLIGQAKEQMALLQSAEGGNTTAGERLENIRRNKSFSLSKFDIFGSIENEVKFSRLQDYLQSGAAIGISNNEALYIDTLRLIDGMERHYGRRQTLKALQNKPFNLSWERAKTMIEEATNLFYSDKMIDRKALRNKRAEMMEEMAVFARANAKNSNDLKIAGDLLMQASRLQELDKQELPALAKELFQKPVRIFMLDPEKAGITGASRKEIAADIETLTIPEREKQRIKYEAMIEDVIPIAEMLDNAKKED